MSSLDEKTVGEIKDILFRFINPKKVKAFIFGSRALGNARKFSDVDIGLRGKSEIPLGIKSAMEEAFEESDIPFTVDVVNFSSVSDRFAEVAKQKIIYLN